MAWWIILLIVLACVVVGFFLLTFTIYWFNLDMKLMDKVYKLLWKHYDNIKRNKEL